LVRSSQSAAKKRWGRPSPTSEACNS
jgi:hypothetical protein